MFPSPWLLVCRVCFHHHGYWFVEYVSISMVTGFSRFPQILVCFDALPRREFNHALCFIIFNFYNHKFLILSDGLTAALYWLELPAC